MATGKEVKVCARRVIGITKNSDGIRTAEIDRQCLNALDEWHGSSE